MSNHAPEGYLIVEFEVGPTRWNTRANPGLGLARCPAPVWRQ